MGFAGVALLALHDKPVHAGGNNWAAYTAIGACLCASLSYGVAASFAKRYLVGVPPLATATGKDAQLLAPLVQLLSSQYAELRRQDESIDKLNGQLRDAQRRIEQLNEKLEALKNIERSLSVRPAAGAPK